MNLITLENFDKSSSKDPILTRYSFVCLAAFILLIVLAPSKPAADRE